MDMYLSLCAALLYFLWLSGYVTVCGILFPSCSAAHAMDKDGTFRRAIRHPFSSRYVGEEPGVRPSWRTVQAFFIPFFFGWNCLRGILCLVHFGGWRRGICCS